ANPIAGLASGDLIDLEGGGTATLSAPAAGGAIDMSGDGDTALLESGTRFGAAIHGFSTADEVDFEAVAYASTDKPVYANGIVRIENSVSQTIAQFGVGGKYTSANFALTDAFG